MWHGLWYSLGRGAGLAARSIGAAPGRLRGSTDPTAVGELAEVRDGSGALSGPAAPVTPGRSARTPGERRHARHRPFRGWQGRSWLPWRLGAGIRADCATAVLSLAAARLCGAGGAAFGRRAVLIYSLSAGGIRVAFGALAQMLSSLRSPSSSIKAVVREQAEGTARVLRERDVIPNRLGIDGVPGSGKSTLARALAEVLDMKWKSLDYRNLRPPSPGLRTAPSEASAKDGRLPGDLAEERTIYEHHRLFRTRDVDAFDAIIYINPDLDEPGASQARVRRRGRGIILASLLDYDKLRKVGKLAFDVCDGTPVAIPNSDLVLKIRPPGGFRAVENAAGRLGAAALRRAQDGGTEPVEGAAGVDAAAISRTSISSISMSKEAMLFLLACGERREGLKAYFLPLGYYVALMGRLAAKLRMAFRRGRRFVTVLCAKGSAGRRNGHSNRRLTPIHADSGNS